jgi:cytochrome c oxidase subunit 1
MFGLHRWSCTHWWPKFTGKMYHDGVGMFASITAFVGFNLTFFPQFIMGTRGMPRRYYDYDPEYKIFHQLSTVGAFILGLSLFAMVCYLMWSFIYGEKAPKNPWGATTLEWEAPTPPTVFNFPEPPEIPELYNYDDLVETADGNWERTAPTGAKPARDHH